MRALFLFFFGIFLGCLFDLLFGYLFDVVKHKPLKISHKFTILKKISLISLPIWGLIAVIAQEKKLFLVFLYSAILGTLLEFLLGKFIYSIFGVKIWTYKHGALGRYTSIYSFPYWGAAGIVFATIGKLVGL